MATAQYTKTQEGENYLFHVVPASAPKFIFVIILGVIFCYIGLNMLGGPKSLPFIFFLIVEGIGVLTIWIGVRDSRPESHRTSSIFRVNAGGIESNGQSFSKDDIHRLVLRNPYNANQIIVYGNVPVGTGAGLAQREKLASVSNSLNVELGGKSHQLAGGMDSVTAYGLLTDVSRIMGYRVTD